MKKLRVGLVGLGKVAESHLAAYKDVEAIDVVAGSDINEVRLKHISQRWGLHGYTDCRELLEKEKLDIACILAPAGMHRELTEIAAGFGVNIFCEKPMALSLEDCKTMISVCLKNNVKFYYGSSYRCLPPIIKAKEMIDQGVLGNIQLITESYVGGSGPEGWIDVGPHHYPVGGPGGGGMGLVDHGIHFADIIPWLAGSEVESVFGRGNYSGKTPHTEFLTMMFKSGAMGQLQYHEATYPSIMPGEGIFSLGASWNVKGELVPGGDWDIQPQSIHIHGDKGALRIFHYANQLFLINKDGQKQIPVATRSNPGHFGLQIELFVNSIIHDQEPPVSGRDGLMALQIILSAYESYENRTLVTMDNGLV